MQKRQDYISWDEYFMGLALLSAQRSKDPRTQVGACIVDARNRIMSVGYNGFPRGCSDDEFPWEAQNDDHFLTKYPYVCHAELNAILNCDRNLDACRLYVALFPCCECAKAVIQCGIREVIYLSDRYAEQVDFRAARRLFEAAKVQLTKLELPRKELTISFEFS